MSADVTPAVRPALLPGPRRRLPDGDGSSGGADGTLRTAGRLPRSSTPTALLSAGFSEMMDFYHIPGADNPADILSKHWAYGKVWDLLQPLLFWTGDTYDAYQVNTMTG